MVRGLKSVTVCPPQNHGFEKVVWQHYGSIMAALWQHYDIMQHYGGIMTALWQHYGGIMAVLWLHYGMVQHYGSTGVIELQLQSPGWSSCATINPRR